jgi:biopolymer transport protein ExbD
MKALRPPESLKLTSMMDILTVLLLFLLKSFVVDADTMTPPAAITLPESSSPTTPRPSLVVAIQNDVILVANQPVVRVDEVTASSDLFIRALADRLDEATEKADALAVLRGDEEALLKATIQGDRDIEFRVLQRVMYTLSQSGYEEISLAALKNG